MQSLVHQGHTNYLPALLQIPRNMRTMYLHSFQSYLWNLAASHRVAEMGIATPALGDLVLPQSLDAPDSGQPPSLPPSLLIKTR